MKLLRFYILYRLPIAILLIITGVVLHLYVDTIAAILCYVAGGISLLLYFLVGPMRLVQEAASEGDIDKAKELLDSIRFPNLLLKPVRVAYYTLQSNFDLTNNDLDKAEANIRKGLKSKSKLANMTGMNLMQLGFIQMKKGNVKEARQNLMDAIKEGIPDKENLAAVYLQLCNIEIHRRQNRIAKEYFKKAKALNPTTEELVRQIKMLNSQISRLPG